MQTPRITLKPGYADTRGVVHATLEEAQVASLGDLFAEAGHPLIKEMVEQRVAVMAILADPDGEGVPVAAPSAPKRRLSLTCVLDRCRRVALTDAQIAAKVADGTITKVPKIGDASVALLKEWAAAYRPASAPPEVATAAFEQMREAVNAA